MLTQVAENPRFLLVCDGRSAMLSRAADFVLVAAVTLREAATQLQPPETFQSSQELTLEINASF